MGKETSNGELNKYDPSVEISPTESFKEFVGKDSSFRKSFERNSLYKVVDKHQVAALYSGHLDETENDSEAEEFLQEAAGEDRGQEIYKDELADGDTGVEYEEDGAEEAYEEELDHGDAGVEYEEELDHGDAGVEYEEEIVEIIEEELVDPVSGAALYLDANPTEEWEESNQYSTTDETSTEWVDDGKILLSPLPVAYSKDPGDAAANNASDNESYALEIPGIDEMSSLEELSIGDKSADALNYEEISYDRLSVQSLLSSSQQKLNVDHPDWDFDDEDDSDSEESSEGILGLDDLSLAVSQAASLDAFSRPASHSSLMASLDGRKKKSLFVGRKDELELLRYALDDADLPTSDNPPRLIWITGPGGIGKSTLAEEFIQTDVVRKGFLIGRGSFDEKGHGTTPFAAFVDCLLDITDQLMETSSESSIESEESGLSEYKEYKENHEFNAFKEKILKDLKGDTQFISTFLPSFCSWLGIKADKVDEKSFDLTTGRLFDRTRFDCRRVLRSLCRYHKICLYLDDMHSADDDSLRLIESVLSTYGLKNFIFIGCHRGVKATHLLPKMKKKFSSLNAADVMLEIFEQEEAQTLVLGVLDEAGLPTKDENLKSLTSFVLEKGGGNPFNLKQLTLYLVDKGHIKLNKGKLKLKNQYFRSEAAYPCTSIDIAFERIMLLSNEGQLALKSAGFLGVMFFRVELLYQAISVLITIEKNPVPSPIDDVEDINFMLTGAVDAGLVEDLSGGNYCFMHDTIRKAAMRMLPKEKKEVSLLHYEFAEQLFQNKSEKLLSENPELKEEVNVALVDHFGAAIEHQKKAGNKEVQAKLNLELAESAMWKGSFALAARRAETGLGFLDPKRKWKINYRLAVRIHIALARIQFCQQKYKESKVNADMVIANAKNERDKVNAYDILINILMRQKEFEEAFEAILLALKEIWSEVPSTAVEEEVRIIRTAVNAKTDEDILTLPPIEHKKTFSKLSFLARLADASWCCHDYLHQDLAALRMVQLSLEYGSSPYANLAFSLYGICLSRRGLHREAFRFGQIAEVTAELDTTSGAQASTFYHFGVSYWGKPFESSIEPLQKAAMVAVARNDMENLPFRTGVLLSHSFVAGANLKHCDKLFRKFKEYAVAFGGRDCWLVTLPYKLYLTLRGDSLDLAEKGFEKVTDTRSSQYWLFFRMILAVFMQEFDKAEKLSKKVFLKPEGVWVPYRGFIEGLIAADLARKAQGKARIKYQSKAAKTVEVLSIWAKKGMTQAFHMANLVKTELRMSVETRLETRSCCALYNTSIDAAARAGFIHHEALANERAGITVLSQQEEQLAAMYLIRARQLYDEWGAKKKINLLNAKYSRLFADHGEQGGRIDLNHSDDALYLDHGAGRKDLNHSDDALYLDHGTGTKDLNHSDDALYLDHGAGRKGLHHSDDALYLDQGTGRRGLHHSNDALYLDHGAEESYLDSDFDPPIAMVDVGGWQETNLSPVNSPSHTRPRVVLDSRPGAFSGIPVDSRADVREGRMPVTPSQGVLPSRRTSGVPPARARQVGLPGGIGTVQGGAVPGRGALREPGERGRGVRGRGFGQMRQSQRASISGPPTRVVPGPIGSPIMGYPQRGPRMMGRGPSSPPVIGRGAGFRQMGQSQRSSISGTPRPTGMGRISNVQPPGSIPPAKSAATGKKLQRKQAKPATFDSQQPLTNVVSAKEIRRRKTEIVRTPVGTAQKQSIPERASFVQSFPSNSRKQGALASFMVSPNVLAATSKSKGIGKLLGKAIGMKEEEEQLQFLSPPPEAPKSSKYKGPSITRNRHSIAGTANATKKVKRPAYR